MQGDRLLSVSASSFPNHTTGVPVQPCVEHGYDDMADVVVTTRAPIAKINFARDSYYANEIVQYLGLSSPFNDDDIIRFFEFQVALKDRLVVAENLTAPSARPDGAAYPTKICSAAQELIVSMTMAGAKSGRIRQVLLDEMGIDVSPSHLSHLKKRLMRNGPR